MPPTLKPARFSCGEEWFLGSVLVDVRADGPWGLTSLGSVTGAALTSHVTLESFFTMSQFPCLENGARSPLLGVLIE